MEDGQMYISTEVIVLVTILSLPKLARQVVHQFCILSTYNQSVHTTVIKHFWVKQKIDEKLSPSSKL